MYQQKYPQNCLLMFLAVYLINFFLTNYYKKYPKSSKKAQNVIKAPNFA